MGWDMWEEMGEREIASFSSNMGWDMWEKMGEREIASFSSSECEPIRSANGFRSFSGRSASPRTSHGPSALLETR